MADEMDPCECLWNNELAMRRLLSLVLKLVPILLNFLILFIDLTPTSLRQGQSYCTDSECLEELPGLPQAESAGNSFLMMFLMMAFAVAMYMMRPRRNRIQDVAKPTSNSQDRDGAPPTPPRI